QNSTHCYCDATQHTPIYHTLSSFLALPRPPSSTLFPYTTLFRSRHGQRERHAEEALEREEQYRAGQQQQTQAYHLRRGAGALRRDRKSTRLNSSHVAISYAVFCLKKKKGTRALQSNAAKCLELAS